MKKVGIRTLFALILVVSAWTISDVCLAQEETFTVVGARTVVPDERIDEDSTSAPQSNASGQLLKYSNDNSQGFVRLDVDRKDRAYQEGDKVILNVLSSIDGYLYLFDVNSEGETTILFPNKFCQENRIASGVPTVCPSARMNFELKVQGPTFGAETFKAFVTPHKLELPKEATSTQFYSFHKSEIEQFVEQLKSADLVAKDVRPVAKVVTGSLTFTTTKKLPKPTKARRFFVGIAVSRFKDEDIVKLDVCSKDVDEVAAFWKEKGDVDDDRCFILKDEEATKENIRKLFEELRQRVQPGDVVVVYVSTHGLHDSYDTYVFPYDGKNPDKYGVDEVAESLVSSNEFEHWLNEISFCNILFFADACHSGGLVVVDEFVEITKGFGEDEEIPFCFGFNPAVSKAIGGDSVFGICSCSEDERSYPSRDGSGLSVFTKFLVEAFQDKDVRTHKDIADYVRPKVRNYMREYYYNARQTVVEHDELNPGVLLRPSK